MKDKCPHCHKMIEIAGFGEKKCPKCHGEVFITPDENDKNIIHAIVDLKVIGVPMQGDIFIDIANIPGILSSRFSLENLSPLFGNILQSILSKKSE